MLEKHRLLALFFIKAPSPSEPERGFLEVPYLFKEAESLLES